MLTVTFTGSTGPDPLTFGPFQSVEVSEDNLYGIEPDQIIATKLATGEWNILDNKSNDYDLMTIEAVPVQGFSPTVVIDCFEFNRTKFDDGQQRLLYGRVGESYSFFHQVGTDEPRRVGPLYPRRDELVADLHRFGTGFGFTYYENMGVSGVKTYYVQSLSLCGLADERYARLSWRELSSGGSRGIGGDVGSVHFHGYELDRENNVTKLITPCLITTVDLTKEEVAQIAGRILLAAFEDVGMECIEQTKRSNVS
jgi:hypothetical protein